MADHFPRKEDRTGSSPVASSMRDRLLRLKARADRIRGSEVQSAERSVGIREVVSSILTRSSTLARERERQRARLVSAWSRFKSGAGLQFFDN